MASASVPQSVDLSEWKDSFQISDAEPATILSELMQTPSGADSLVMFAINYFAQVLISVLQGANFTTLQLMVNYIISFRQDKSLALPLANGWMVSVQSIARGISPLAVGSTVESVSVCKGSAAFDMLAGVASVARRRSKTCFSEDSLNNFQQIAPVIDDSWY